jgi:hypothetical protein
VRWGSLLWWWKEGMLQVCFVFSNIGVSHSITLRYIAHQWILLKVAQNHMKTMANDSKTGAQVIQNI